MFFFSSCGMFTGAVWLVNLKFAAKSAEVLPRWLCIISKEMFCKLRYPFLSNYTKVTTFIYNWSPNGRKKKGISHIFCWIHENFVDNCPKINLCDLKIMCSIDFIVMIIFNGWILAWVSKTFFISMKSLNYILFGKVIMADF